MLDLQVMMRISDWDYGKENRDRFMVYRNKSGLWTVWRGLDWLQTCNTHEDAINCATEEARFDNFWTTYDSKVPNATRMWARKYWENHMTKEDRNEW